MISLSMREADSNRHLQDIGVDWVVSIEGQLVRGETWTTIMF